jgi:UDP-N-acetylmuramyl pentapeptide phosphotransferase/UDP-N-acetylglucosamine-1-phosphate transferase
VALLAFLVGLLAVRFLRLTTSGVLETPVLQRVNYRGASVPTGGGVLAVLAVLGVEAARATLGALGLGDETGLSQERSLVLFGVVAFGLLGFIDDTLGDDTASGFRGHLGSLASGRLTTGFVKLAGGGAVAVLLVAAPGFRSGARLVVDAALIALAANLANLLDRAPGRALKVGLLSFVPLVLAVGIGSAVGVAIALPIGALAGLLGDDLRERLMLGDTGANVLGAVLGLGVVLGTSSGVRLTVLFVLLALNLASEVMSFSAVITRTAPLRRLDELGRRGLPG